MSRKFRIHIAKTPIAFVLERKTDAWLFLFKFFKKHTNLNERSHNNTYLPTHLLSGQNAGFKMIRDAFYRTSFYRVYEQDNRKS